MAYADAIRRQAEEAPRAALPAVIALLWRAYGEGHVTEAEAETLSALIEARQARPGSSANLPTGRANGDTPPNPPGSPSKPVGSRPVSGASLERRRRWAASGRLPPAIAARFTLGEQAALALVAAETARRGDCRLAVGQLAALAGISETTVRNAIREARRLGLVTVEERRLTGFRNDTNIVRIVSAEWSAWLRLARKASPPWGHLAPRGGHHGPSPSKGGGCKLARGTPTEVLDLGIRRPAEPSQGLPGTGGRPRRGCPFGIGEGGEPGSAML